MQKKASIAQRLVQETGFREAACTAFSYAGRNQSSDLLQRCKALNACIQQVRVLDSLHAKVLPLLGLSTVPTHV